MQQPAPNQNQQKHQDKKMVLPRSERYAWSYTAPQWKILYYNLLGGLAWGVGTVIGVTLFLGVFGLLISRTRNIPLIGEITEVVIQEINRGRRTVDEEFNIEGNNGQSGSNPNPSNILDPIPAPVELPDSFPS